MHLAARDAVTKLESKKKFEEYRSSLIAQLCPVGAAEELLCKKIVTTAWRLRRVIRLKWDYYAHFSAVRIDVGKSVLSSIS
jgi:hypothetical protein